MSEHRQPQKKNRVSQLPVAEYATPAALRDHARAFFLGAVQDLEPDFLSSLFRGHDDLWKPLRKLARRQLVASLAQMKAATQTRDPNESSVRRLVDLVEVHLRSWARKWNLPYAWCEEWAFQQLLYASPRDASPKDAGTVADIDEAGDAFSPRRFTLDAWQPTETTRAEYERAAREALKCYVDKIESDAKALGLLRIPFKWQLQLHVEWLARKIVQRWSWEQIRKAYDRPPHRERGKPLDIKTVRDGVDAAAELVDIEVPRGKPGRPIGVTERLQRRRRAGLGR